MVSHCTVHSHVRAIYRKLAVSSPAPTRGRQLGLLSPASKRQCTGAVGVAAQVYLPPCR